MGRSVRSARWPVRVDVLVSLSGVEFHSAWESRERGAFEGLSAWFIGREQLIQNKVAGRKHVDLHDAEQLRLKWKRRPE